MTDEITEETVLRHICEGCGKDENLTVAEAFEAGWDYPPRLGVFGVVSPRTCGECGIEKTLWWRIQTGEVRPDDLSSEEMEFIQRVVNEPESILVKEEK
jgi:hypothetical protein